MVSRVLMLARISTFAFAFPIVLTISCPSVEGHCSLQDPGFSSDELVVVPTDTITNVMRREASRGYDIVPVPNSARFFTAVVLGVARNAHARNPDGPPLVMKHEDWYHSFLEVAGLEPEEAPIAKRLAHENRQDVYLDYDRTRIFKSVDPDESVEFALNIEISWPDEPGRPGSYSFYDTTSVPEVQVTNRRVIRFRLLDLGDMIVYDDIEGITGRPATGLLATLFKVIGEGSLKWSRIAITDDGLQIGRARVKKLLFTVTETVTVFPDGQAVKGLPEDRPDLLAVEERLKEELDFEYRDW